LDARELKPFAREQGVVIESGDIYFHKSPLALNFFRLGYSSIKTLRILAGIERLSKVIKQLT